MKTIKAIIFGALIVTAIVTGLTVVLCMCAVDTSDIWEFLKMFFWNAIICGASVLAIRYLYERWYRI